MPFDGRHEEQGLQDMARTCGRKDLLRHCELFGRVLFYLSVNLFFICVIQFQDGRSCKFRGGGPLGGLVVPFGLGFSPFLNYGLCRHTCYGHALYLTFLIRWESRLYPLFFLSVHGYHIPVVFGLVADVRCYHHCYPVLYSCMVAVSVYPSEWLYRLQSV